MLKNKLKLLLTTLMIVCLALSTLSFADNENVETEQQQNQQQEQTATEATENMDATQQNVKSGDQYLMGDSINVDYIIDGNLFVMANEVTISNQVVGNAYVLANKITVTDKAYIGASLYALGNEVEMNGITFDAYVSASQLNLSGYVYRDLHSVSNDFKLSGVVGRDASIAAKNISFEKSEATDQNAQTAKGQCKIMGALNYSSENEIQIPENVVTGNVSFEKFEDNTTIPAKNYVFDAITSVVFVLAIWGLYKWLAPKFLEKQEKLISSKPLKTFGFGLLGLVVLPIICIILLIMNVTASVGLLLLIAYIVLIIIGRSTCLIGLNNLLANKFKFDTNLKKALLLVVTSLIAWAISTFIPVVNGIFNLIIIVIGIGVIIRNLISKKDLEKAE